MATVAVVISCGLCIPPLLALALEVSQAGVDSGVSVERLFELMARTLALMLVVASTSLVVGTLTALIVTRTNFPGRGIFSVLIVVPLVIPAYVLALVLVGMSGGAGLLTQLVAPFGVAPLPPAQGFTAAALCLILSNIPVVHALVVSGVRRLDPALEESARLLGDSSSRVLTRVILPQLRAALGTAVLLVSLYVLSDFGAVSILRYDTFTRAIYSQLRGRVELAPAFALCGALVMVASILIFLAAALRGKQVSFRSRSTPPPIVRLSALGRVFSMGFLGAVVAATLAVPVGTLLFWSIRGLRSGVVPGPILIEAANTVQFALASAILITVLAVPIALSSYRGRSILGRLSETLPWITHSLPHMAIGLAFLIVSLALPSFFYQSEGMLLLVYAAIFLPIAVGVLQQALRQVDSRILEASLTLGRGHFQTGMLVVFPLVWRAGATGALLVAVAVAQELPATLLLRPSGIETLAIRIWASIAEGQITTASIAALLLILLSAPLVTAHHKATVRGY